jgi:uncharacterized protein YndB with AHSA1/START domain
VWEFLVEPEMMTRWMGVTAEAEPRAGGLYRVNVNGEDVAAGEFVTVEPHSRVVFTWGWEGTLLAPGSSTVTITLTPSATGTSVTLVHDGLPEPMHGPHEEGWTHYLERLRIAAAGNDPGHDTYLKT